MIAEPENATIDTIVRILRKSRSVLFVTGAGMSVGSGMPTYRGIGGLYEVDTTSEGYEIEEIVSASMLAENPALTWKYLAEIGKAAHGAGHNRGHEIIAEMESEFPRVWTVTQNVDGFHSAAGAKNVIEMHGNMSSVSCTSCSFHTKADELQFDELPPRCPRCNSILRPDVVLFGELIDFGRADQMQKQLEMGFDIVFSVGTSSLFPYIQAPIHQAKQAGNATVEINPGDTVVSYAVDYCLRMNATAALEAIWSRYQQLA